MYYYVLLCTIAMWVPIFAANLIRKPQPWRHPYRTLSTSPCVMEKRWKNWRPATVSSMAIENSEVNEVL